MKPDPATNSVLERLVSNLIAHPPVVARGGDPMVHLAGPAPDMKTLCGVEYDSAVTRLPDDPGHICATCADRWEASQDRPATVDSNKLQQIGRLAMRAEGDRWNAYYAMPGTMEGALWLGSILLSIIERSEERRAAFLAMMRDVVADMIEKTSGMRPVWGSELDPPRAGAAATPRDVAAFHADKVGGTS